MLDLTRDAAHLFCADTDAPRGAGVVRGFPLPDALTSGPAHVDERRHVRLRQLLDQRGGAASGRRWPRPARAVLWTSMDAVDRLFEWHAIARLRSAEIWLVDVTDRSDRWRRVSTLPRDEAGAALQRARKLSQREIAKRQRRWRDFASGDLGALARDLRDEPLVLAWLQDVLPRARQISRYDESILRCFSRWSPPLALARRARDLFLTMGDAPILQRLSDWERAGALASIPARGRAPYADRELRLTPLGLQVLRSRASLERVPTMFVGGHAAYAIPKWIVGAGGRIVRGA